MTAHNSNPSSAPFDLAELKRLIAASSDDALQPAERDRLEQILAASREARAIYIAYMQLDAGLDWKVRGHESVHGLKQLSRGGAPRQAAGVARVLSAGSQANRTFQRPLYLSGAAALAASLLLAFGVVFWVASQRGERLAGASRDENPRVTGLDPRAVATIVELSEECNWFVENRQHADTLVEPGDLIRLTRGQLRLEFASGAAVTMRSPAALEVISHMRARAVLGTLTAHVQKGAEGFTVETPRTTVVDLGTDFGIDVTPHGSTDVVVFHGSVDLHSDGVDGLQSRQRLGAGEGVRVSGEGTASRIVSIIDSQFSIAPGTAAARHRTPVISAVRDNIRRGESWHYYEVVHGGMREEAKAFVDRDHEWNGVDPSGMPSYLIGGDYVKTFNDDKVNREVEIRLTLDRPAILYVLLDKRSPPPDWLRDKFFNTGDEIGIDGGGYTRFGERKTLGTGAGVSIDDTFSIWRRDVRKAGTVKLGAIQIGGEKHNMYGIVAVPLEIHDGRDDFPGSVERPCSEATQLVRDSAGGWSIDGAIERPADADVFRFDWTGGGVEVVCQTSGFTTFDPVLHVYDESELLIGYARSEPAGRDRVAVTIELPSGAYYVAVTGSDEAGDVGVYHLQVTPASGPATPPLRPSPSLVLNDIRAPAVEHLRTFGRSPQAIILEWRDVVGERAYRIERSTGGEPFATVGTAPQNSNGYCDDTVEPGRRYVYRVATVSAQVDEAVSQPVCALSGVADLSATAAASDRVVLSWTADYPHARLFLERAAGRSGAFVPIAALDGSTRSYIDDTAGAGEELRYRVLAVEDVGELTELRTAELDSIRLPEFVDDDHFALRINGKIRIDKRGKYNFYLNSDDGGRLFIDGTLVVDNDGRHAPRTVVGTIVLDAGEHDLETQYFEHDGKAVLDLSWSGPGIPISDVPSSVFSSLSCRYYKGVWWRLPFDKSSAVSQIVTVRTPVSAATADADK